MVEIGSVQSIVPNLHSKGRPIASRILGLRTGIHVCVKYIVGLQ